MRDMPAPARTSKEAIVAAARDLVEADGLEALSMQAVAAQVGVRPPSLYKHVADRDALIAAVLWSVIADLAAALRVDHAADPAETLRAIARRYRTFVHDNPVGYAALFQPDDRLGADSATTLADLGRPIVEAMARLVGEAQALEAARTFVAWAHGFTSLELVGGFRLGGNVDRAYETGIDLILAGVSERGRPRAG